MQDERNLLVFSGNANQPLAREICRELGIRQGKAMVSRFSDGEVQVEIEENVRGRKCSWCSRLARRPPTT